MRERIKNKGTFCKKEEIMDVKYFVANFKEKSLKGKRNLRKRKRSKREVGQIL